LFFIIIIFVCRKKLDIVCLIISIRFWRGDVLKIV